MNWRVPPENWRGNDIFFLEINFAATLSYAFHCNYFILVLIRVARIGGPFKLATAQKRLRITGLDRHTCRTYTRSTVVGGLSVLCEAVSLGNEWRLSQTS